MDDLLTTKELLELLRVDRTTVYRMLRSGRLTGIKLGGQWRFARSEVNSLLAGATSAVGAESSGRTVSPVALPLHCIQHIQSIFAEVAGVGAVTVAPTGEPLTEMRYSCRFCNLILSSPSGRRACIASWNRLAEQSERRPRMVTCHAGLQYARARIEVTGHLEAMFIAGQYYTEAPDLDAEAARVQHLADTHGLDSAALAEAATELTVLDDHKQARIGDWLQNVAHTFEEIGRERAELIGRLRQIAEMSTLEPA
jgi:excisionase family DNA binding protein